MNALLPTIVVVLVEPRSPGNIGMVARAMANFGATELRLVNPCDYESEEARRLAVDAVGLLQSAKVFPALAAALGDCERSVAASRRSGKRRGAAIDVSQVAAQCLQGPKLQRLALVFGREDAGLTSAEVARCTHTAAISTPGFLGSLNLAQAVLIFLYELNRSEIPSGSAGEVPTHEEMEPIFSQMAGVLERIAFLNPHRPEHVLTPLRRLLVRGIANRHELELMRGIWSRLEESINDWRGRRRGDEKPG
jgi:tRNA/rRNA methyltransferase